MSNFLRLLEMYLDPQDGKDPMFTAAVRLLHNHGESLDPLQVLEVLNLVYISFNKYTRQFHRELSHSLVWSGHKPLLCLEFEPLKSQQQCQIY